MDDGDITVAWTYFGTLWTGDLKVNGQVKASASVVYSTTQGHWCWWALKTAPILALGARDGLDGDGPAVQEATEALLAVLSAHQRAAYRKRHG
jgi:hypothetical protein